MGRNQYYKDIQLPQLRSFCLAADQGNFTTAARALGLSVPTVWQHVRALERELEAPLLRRRGRAVEVTSEGRLLLELIQPHVSGLDSLASLFHMRRSELPQTLTVASTYYLISYHLPKPVHAFAARHSTIRLNLRPGLWSEALRQVERGDANLGVIPYEPDEPRPAALEYEHLFDLRFMLLTASDHPLAHKKRLTPADLVQYPMILQPRENYGYRMMERILRRHEVLDQLNVVMESQSTDTVLKYVALGIGIAVLYIAESIAPALPGVRMRLLDPVMAGLPVALITRKGAYLAEPVEDFRKTVRQHLARKGSNNQD